MIKVNIKNNYNKKLMNTMLWNRNVMTTLSGLTKKNAKVM